MLDQPAAARGLAEQPPAVAEPARRLVLAAVMMAIFMAAIDLSIVATAMPTIVAELGGFHLFSWTFAAYLLAQAVTIPIYGRLADLYGRKRVFFAGASLFLLGSTLCGLAWGMVPVILFRGLQGAGAGAVQPIATTIVGDIYGPAERARIQGYISAVWGVAAVIGPTLGAFLVEHVSWSFVFWINLPIGAATFVMFSRFLHEHQRPRRHRIDYLGSVLMVLGAGGIMLALMQIGNSGEVTAIAVLGAGGAVALIALAAHERSAPEPLLPLNLWRNRVVVVGCLANFANGAIMMSLSAFLPTYVQGAMGRSPAAAGITLAVSSVSWTFASMASGRLMIRTSYRLAAGIGGVCLVASSLVLMTLDPSDSLLRVGTGALLERNRHGVLQYRLYRLDSGCRRLERARHGHQFDDVHAHGRFRGWGRGIRRDRQFRHPSPVAGSRKRGQPADAAGGAASAQCPRDRKADRGDRELDANRLCNCWARRTREFMSGSGIAG